MWIELPLKTNKTKFKNKTKQNIFKRLRSADELKSHLELLGQFLDESLT